MPIKAIIFDIDNTLIDWTQRSLGWFDDPNGHHAHLAKAAQYANPSVTDDQIVSLISAFHQIQLDILENSLARAPHLGMMLSDLLLETGITDRKLSPEEAVEAYGWESTHGVDVFPDVPAALAHFHEQGYKLGIITNGYQPMYQRDKELAHQNILHYFSDCRFSSADVGVLKPDRKIFEVAIQCMGFLPDEMAYVGDHPVSDVLGAQQAGLKGIWRAPLHYDSSQVGWVRPDAIIDTFDDLAEAIAAW